MLAPEIGLANPDADLGAPALRVKVAVVRETDRSAFVLDDPTGGVARARHALDPRAGAAALELAWLLTPLVTAERWVAAPFHQEREVVERHRAKCHLRAEQSWDGHAIASPAVGSCCEKSAGSALLSRSFFMRSTNASSVTPRSSSREPRRRTDTVPDAASLSPTTSM